jgi:hypothetical protein
VFVGLSIAPGCQGWEGDVIVSGDKPVDPASLLVCPPETFQIRLLFSDGRLASYHPDAISPLTDVVQLSCGATGAAGEPPPSFAVDRHGDVWIVDGNGTLYRARRGMGTCVTTGFNTVNAGGPFRMAFVADAAAPDKEVLYVAIGTDRTAAGIPQNSELASLGLVGAPVLGKRVRLAGWPILSGTGDLSTGNGRLWGLFPAKGTAAAYAAEIDTRTGALGPKTYSPQSSSLSPRLSSFVFWRGNFWVFPGRTDEPPTVEFDSPPSPRSADGLADLAAPGVAAGAGSANLAASGAAVPANLPTPRDDVSMARLTVPASGSGLKPEVVSAAVSTCATGQ